MVSPGRVKSVTPLKCYKVAEVRGRIELMQASLDGAFPDIPLSNLGSGISRIHLQGVKSVTGLKGSNVKMLQGAETAFFYSAPRCFQWVKTQASGYKSHSINWLFL
jgi:hypothetical protein